MRRLILIFLLVFTLVVPALAQTPTVTPIPWATLTPFPTPNPTSLPVNLGLVDLTDKYADAAEHGVQMWQMGNQNGGIDFFITILLLLLILNGLRVISRDIEELNK